MKKQALLPASIGVKLLNKECFGQSGSTLLELMAVVLIIAITAAMSMPLLQEQIAAREIDVIARRFIAHAHFACQQALNIGQPVLLTPLKAGPWEDGWIVQGRCSTKQTESSCQPKRCLLYTSPSPRDRTRSRMPSSA